MIGFLILIILAIAFYSGARRGTPLQAIYTCGYIITWFVALSYYRGLAQKIELFVPYLSVTPESKLFFYDQETALDLDNAYYAAVAFMMILVMGWLCTKLIALFASDLRFRRLRLLKGYDWLVAGALNAMVFYIVIFCLLFILSMIPLATIQNIFEKSATASAIVEHSPILSKQLYRLWITQVIG